MQISCVKQCYAALIHKMGLFAKLVVNLIPLTNITFIFLMYLSTLSFSHDSLEHHAEATCTFLKIVYYSVSVYSVDY